MKKTLTIITLLAGAVSGYSQGQIVFNAYSSSLRQAIYNTQATFNYTVSYGGYTVNETVGSDAVTHELPTGSQTYTAGTALSGAGYSAELLVGPAGISTASGTVTENATAVGLTPFGGGTGAPVAGFFTGPVNKLGFINSTATLTLPTESYYGNGSTVSVAIAAWNNEGGTVTTLLAAQQAGDPWGISPVAQMTGLTVSPSGGATLAGPESFSLGTSVPEPSTVALGVMGVSALLFRRRK